jgi:hypothetical protein
MKVERGGIAKRCWEVSLRFRGKKELHVTKI